MSKNSLVQSRLIHSLVNNRERGERYAFLLGAGASVASGIPPAAELAKKWLEELKEQDQEEYKKLINKKGFDQENLEESYSDIYDARFNCIPNDGYRAIEDIMNKTSLEPSFGYTVLAQVLAGSRHNLVLTTNFDRLTETALLTYLNCHAAVIAHESLAGLARIEDHRPAVIKVHHDMFFLPKSSGSETRGLSEPWKNLIKQVLANYHLIAVGYGGNDKGLMNLLEEVLKTPGNAKLYWCHRGDDLPQRAQDLEKSISGRFVRVKISGFDEFMLLLNEAMKFNLLGDSFEKNARERKQSYEEGFKVLQDKVDKSDDPKLNEALKDLVANTWWDVERAASKEKDQDKKDRIYIEGLEKFPESHELMGNYAAFLHEVDMDYDKAEEYYKRALKTNSEHGILNGNYAVFLKNIRKDYDKAEKYYQRALKADPNHGILNGNYANFLRDIRKDYDKAEEYYLLALKADPKHGILNGNYAVFLQFIREDLYNAEAHYRRALKADPDHASNNGNYAGFLLAMDRKQEAADYLYKAEKNCGRDQLRLELAFFRLAHYPENMEEARKTVIELLDNGVRVPWSDFSQNIARAEQDGHPNTEELKTLAAKISEELPLK